MQEMQVQSLGQEDFLEEEMATHFSILAWKSPMNRGALWATVHGVTKSQTIRTSVGKVMFLLFNTLSRFVIAFLPRSKCLLISWLQSLYKVILEPKKIKSVTISTFSPSVCHEVMGPEAMILVFRMLSYKPAFSCSSFTFIHRLFSSSLCH